MAMAVDIVKSLIYAAVTKENYSCFYNTRLVKEYHQERMDLDDLLKDVRHRCAEAVRNGMVISNLVLHWIDRAHSILSEDTPRMKKCCFGCCPNCIWNRRQAKMLKSNMRGIRKLLIMKAEFDEGRFTLTVLEDHFSPNTNDFGSTKSEFQKIVKALEDNNCYMIGLYGMGGSGKTTLAKEVAMQVKSLGRFGTVIFVAVSSPTDVQAVQLNIARHLDIQLQGNVVMYSDMLSRRLAEEEQILIILDDIWEELNLKDIGIPCGPTNRNCRVLITTRDSRVCEAMGCQQIIGMQTLTDRDALNLFVQQVGPRNDGSSNEFMGYAQQIVHKCEGLPIAVVTIAATLKNWPLRDWKIALEALQRSEPLHNVVDNMKKVYETLRSSYVRLEGNAKTFFLLASLFPEGYEIPIDLLCKISIGLGLFAEVHDYLVARIKAIAVKDILISSSLLSEAKQVFVKMHSMVRGMALSSNEGVQVIVDSNATVKSESRFLTLIYRDNLPNRFSAFTIEILVLWVKGEVKLEGLYRIFREMASLKVLFLHRDSDRKNDTLSLELFDGLRSIRTLVLDGWKIFDIFYLGVLDLLEILELTNCLVSESLDEIRELKNLRSLGLKQCQIERNNPFKFIERCIRLQELDFFSISKMEGWKEEGERENIDKVAPVDNFSPPTLKRYFIACPHLKYFDHDDNRMLNCFNPENVRDLISNSMFKNIVRRAEVLELGEIEDARWKNLVPDIIPVEEGGMNDLIKLYLYALADMECLVDTSHRDLDYSKVAVFSKLVELVLDNVDAKELYRGPMISGFLEKLKILKLRNCKKLGNVFFDRNLKVPDLKVLHLINCPMFQSSIFHSSVAQSLEQLEELIISDFDELERVIVDVDNNNSYSTLFPKLKTLEIKGCGKLELVFPVLYVKDLPLLEAIIITKCEELKHIFGECRAPEDRVSSQEIMLPSLTKMVLDDVPNFSTLFKECNIDMQGHTISQESPASTKGVQKFHTAQCLLRRPLNLENIRQMTIVQCSTLTSLFTRSLATTIMLEKLTIQRCDKLKHLITNEEDDLVHISIFPELEELLVIDCRNMESVFSSTSSVRLPKLKSVIIGSAPLLKNVFGRFDQEEYLFNEIDNKEIYSIDLPALETLSLTDMPNIISFCTTGKQLNLEAANFRELAASRKGIETFHTAECLSRQPMELQNIRQMTIVQCSTLMSLFTVSIAKIIKLKKLKIQRCDKLKLVVTHEDEEDDGHTQMECISIFPELEELLITDCGNMEFLFPPTSSARLQKLKFVIIRTAPKLKYVFGRFDRGEYLPNENENREIYIDFPALEKISLTNVPQVMGICTSGRQLSLEAAKNLTSQGAVVKPEIEEITEVERPMASSVSTNIVLNFHNLGEIKIIECRMIKVMFPASTWRSLSQLCMLCVISCEELVHMVDEDSKDYDRFSDNHILPKLEYLQIQNCNKLKSIFPSSFHGGLKRLKYMIVEKAADLEYIFGKSSDKDENGIDDVHLPALKTLLLRDVPNIINICTKRRSVRFPSLQQIGLDNCQKLTQDSLNLMVYLKPAAQDSMKMSTSERELTNLEVGNSTINEVFNLEGAKIGGLVTLSLQSMELKNLRELKQICRGSNRSILSFYHLCSLKVIGCGMLRTIFSVSIMKSLPNLFHLKIKDCENLVQIIEEDPQKCASDEDWQQLSFPKLESVHILRCNSLKFLFSISTPNMFPKLEKLEIEEASELQQIFTWKQDDNPKKMIMVVKDEFPTLSYLRLIKLPKLVTIGFGIAVQTVPDYQVVGCPKYEENTSQEVQQEPENLDLDDQAATEKPLSSQPFKEETSSLPNSAENSRKTRNKSVEVPISDKSSEAALAPGSTTFKTGLELKDEQTLKEPIGQLQH